MQQILIRFLSQQDPLEKWRRDRLPTPVFLGFPCGSAGKESTCNAGDLGLIPGLAISPGEGKGYPLQYSGLEKSMDYVVCGVTKNQMRLSLSLSTFQLFPSSYLIYFHLGENPKSTGKGDLRI